ncbi:hypothetical protein IMCC12053_836 [Celeribacter marinus]|uniref:Uncharacterized protein n=1 Tax=Celeribacter marinus TaxID=1397108 RepID=A0A0P0A8K0_9RHOB|nr:hypothetical protein IMCC12053_836 [Celeribacter marinus]
MGIGAWDFMVRMGFHGTFGILWARGDFLGQESALSIPFRITFLWITRWKLVDEPVF